MKHARWKKLIVSILAVAMIFTNIPTTALAQTQTEATPLAKEENTQTPDESSSESGYSAENPYESRLPVVYINTENGVGITSKDYYVNATMKIQGNDTYSDESILYDGAIEISGRGNSTWGMPKKPYKIKLDKKKNLFDMGNHKRWVLLANYSDESLMRNTLAYNLSGELGMPQMETVWVDVVLNGEYVGNYQFCEQIKIDDDNRVDIFDWESFAEDAAAIIAEAESLSEDDAGDLEDYMKEENMSWITSGEVNFNNNVYKISDYEDIEVPAITGGYLMELDEYYDEVSKFKTESNQPIMFKSPEFVSTNKDMMDYIQGYIQSFENAVQSVDYTADYNGTSTHYSELFDFNSLVDYWLINEIFFNEELNKKSTYMYKDIDGLVHMGPIWDMDYSSGGEGQTYQTNKWATVYYNTNAQANMWYKDLIRDPYFVLKAQERYWEIRNTTVQAMVDSIDTNYEYLKDSADANADIWYTSRNFDSHVNNLKTWFTTHLTWLDTQMNSQTSLLQSLGYETSNLTLSATDSTGASLRKDTISGHAAADALVNIGESISLTVSSNTYDNENVDVFVNGKKIASTQVGSTITIEQLTADYGKKNTIEVKLSGSSKSAQNCMTVIETDTSELPPIDPDEPSEPSEPGTPDTPNTPETSDPEYEGRDYPVASMTAIADSQYKGNSWNEGPADFILDEDDQTHWHTNWNTTEATDIAKRWVGVELAEATMIDGIRCLPRQSGVNGIVTSYEIQYRMTTTEEWQTATTGNWDKDDTGWQIASFAPVEAKYVRVVGVHTHADKTDNLDSHMSMAELRVQQAADENAKTVTSISVEKAATKTTYTAGETFNPAGLEINVTYSDGTSEVIAYDVSGVTLTPAANTVLKTSDNIVTISYGGKRTTMNITVEAGDPGNTEEPENPGTPEDPEKPEDSENTTYESRLPVVYINTENGVKITSKDYYVNATMKIQGNDTYSDASILYDGDIEISGRGNSTWSMPKKPYKIKLDKKSNLFNMGKHKRWVLLANYSDESLMRNTLSYNLSGKMGMPQMETVWVDVVLNGEYVGNYQFCEQIKIDDDNRVDIFDWESLAEDAAEIIATAENLSDDDAGDLEDFMKEEDMSWITSGEVKFNDNVYKISDYEDIEVPAITGGYLMELDEYYDEVSKFKTESNQPIMFKSPEFVSTNTDMMNYIQTYIQSFENAVQSTDYTANYDGTTTHYSELFDFNSLVDYWLINEIFFNEEINKKSTYMYKDIDGLVYMGPIWDMDYSSGGEGRTYHTNKWATLFFDTNAQANMWYKDLVEDPYFILKAQERYWEIRNTYVQEMLDYIDTSYEYLKDSADANADIWYTSQNFESNVNGLKTWFTNHLTWMDEQMETQSSILASLNYEANELQLSITDTDKKSLAKDDISTKATADALIEDGQALLLTVTSDTLTGNADVYVNSRKIDSVAIGSEIIITAEQLSAAPGKKDIIEVKVVEDNGAKGSYEVAQNCLTVLEKPAPVVDLKDATVTLSADSFTYDGTEKLPEVTVTYNETTLTKDTDYTVTITNNVEVGTATVTVTGIGNYQGTVTKTFTITAAEPNPGDTEKPDDTEKPGDTEKPDDTEKPGDTVVADKTALDRAITQATALKAEDYTAASYANVQTLLTLAKSIIDKKDATQAEVDVAVTALEAAIKALVKVEVTPDKPGTTTVNKDALTSAITAAEALKSYDYTKTSWNALQAALTTAKTVSAKADATQAEVDAAKAALDAAVKNLVEDYPIAGPVTQAPLKKGSTFVINRAQYKVTKLNGKTGEVSFVSQKNVKNVVIPATVKEEGITFKVTSIAKNAFKNNKSVTKITAGKNIVTIGANAFFGCTALTKVTLGTKVTTIDAKAFYGCSKLTAITIPKNVTKLGASMFTNCKKLKTITIKTTKLTKSGVAKGAFKGLGKSTKIKVPAKSLKVYKTLFKSKGLSTKVKVTK